VVSLQKFFFVVHLAKTFTEQADSLRKFTKKGICSYIKLPETVPHPIRLKHHLYRRTKCSSLIRSRVQLLVDVTGNVQPSVTEMIKSTSS
jgi:hypothetical protein